MPESESTGNSKLSGVEGGAPPEKTTAQSGRGALVPVDEHGRLPGPHTTRAAQDFATHVIQSENKTPQGESKRFWGFKKKKKEKK